jgi:hypothetical protein
MTASGTLITAAQYNSLQSQVSAILYIDPSNPANGYNIFPQSSQLVRDPTTQQYPVISSPLHWAKLRNDILNCAAHQGTSVTALSALTITTGTLIYATQYDVFVSAVALIVAGKNNVDVGQYTTNSLTAPSITVVAPPSTPQFKSQMVHSFTVSWTSAENMRGFFNSGGLIKFDPTRPGGDESGNTAPAPQNLAWDTLLSAIDTVSFGVTGTSANVGTGSSVTPYNLTLSAVQIYTYTGGVTYGGNDYTILASCNVANNNTGTATSITFNVQFNDDYAGRGTTTIPPGTTTKNTAYDYVTGTFTNTITYRVSTGNVNAINPALASSTFTSV